jgi:chromosome segregation ATPase
MTERDWAAEAREHLAKAAEPLRVQLVEVSQQIHDTEVTLKRLRDERRFIKETINRLDPPAKKTLRTTVKNRRQSVTRIEQVTTAKAEQIGMVRKFISDHADKYADGLTAAQVHRDIQAESGNGVIGPAVVKEIVEDFHTVGFLRADKKVRGGAMQYKLVSP